MLADAEYRKNDKQRWRGLLEQLLYHDNATNWWWVWHDLTGDRIKDIHPFIRMGFVETIDYYSKVGYSVGIVGYTSE
ncbi:MAG: hypothetical protein WBF33_30705 [Candidatus Nitrosopolaris sp.]|jgi:hypothetical protein